MAVIAVEPEPADPWSGGRRPEYGLTMNQIEAEMIRLDNSDDAPLWI